MQKIQTKDRPSHPVIIVTGAASGIGRAIAHRFLESGAFVTAVDIQWHGKSAPTHHRFSAITADISTQAGCQEVFQQLTSHSRALAVLINCAGTIQRTCVVTTTPEDWDNIINTNLRSIYLMSRLAIPIMAKNNGGAIVNVSSGWGLTGGARAAAYCASKAGVVALTKAMAIDHGAQNIRVNCVCPGDTHTPMLEKEALQLGVSVNTLYEAAKSRPLGRVGSTEEIADAVYFFSQHARKFHYRIPGR